LAVCAQFCVEEFRRYWGLDADSPPDDVGPAEWEVAKIFDTFDTS
jgi:hypothetical protein